MSQPLKKEDVDTTLGLDRPGGGSRVVVRWAVLAAAALVVLAGAVWYLSARDVNGGTQYVSAPVVRHNLVVTVTATGTLEPTNEVEVSSELSGTVRQVLVDNNDHVVKGQVLAELDTDKLKAQVTRAQATLTAAQARVKEADAAYAEANRNFQRVSQLAKRKVVSEHDLDVARSAYERAAASLESAKADVKVAQADLELRQTDLKNACICSPIDGVVLRRNVEPGQTVAATLQAPTLFSLADDLAKMELRVDVDEADISFVKAGQEATFTVDAYPDRQFPATITKVRFAPDTVEGVVTYETYLDVDNSQMLLRPGMTATAQITVKTIKDALLVPNEALRFAPPPTSSSENVGLLRSLIPHPPRRQPGANMENAGSKRVWVLENGELKGVPVTIGFSDGKFTEILSGDLKPGMRVVTDMRQAG